MSPDSDWSAIMWRVLEECAIEATVNKAVQLLPD